MSRADQSLERERFLVAVRETLADERDARADARERAMDARESAIDSREQDLGWARTDVERRQAERLTRAGAAERHAEAVERRRQAAAPAPVSERWRLDGQVARQFALLAAELYAEDTLQDVLRRITERAAT